MQNQVVQQLSRNEALALTSKIKARTEELWSLLYEAYERKAWAALGYASWREYAQTEFKVSQSRAYQLLDQATVVTKIQGTIEDSCRGKLSTKVEISERDARAIKPVIHQVTTEIREKVQAGADPVETTYAVIEAKRADKPSKHVEKPEPGADEGPTLDELVDDLQAENTRLTALLKAAEADDLKAEAIKWKSAYDRALASQSEAMDAAARSEKREKFTMRQLMRCGKAVGEDDVRNIAAKVEAMARRKAAA